MILLIGSVVLLIYIYFVNFVIRKILKLTKIENKVNQISLVALLIFIAYLIPFGDHHLGRYYFNHLCETDGGVTVYKTISLPESYFDEKGMLIKYKKIRTFDQLYIKNRYIGKWELYPQINTKFRIGLQHQIIYDQDAKQVVSEDKSYYFKGGWFINSIGYEVSSVTCKDRKPDMLVKKTFLIDSK